MYTLKKHKQKLKKRGLGPFVVNQLSTSREVCLKTLEGAQMPNFINGHPLKRYEGSLTEEMLEQLHKAKMLHSRNYAMVATIASVRKEMERASHHPTVEDNVD